MRGFIVLLLIALCGVGCQHAKPKAGSPVVTEYALPPDEPRFNQPPPAAPPSGPHFLVGGIVPSSPPEAIRPGGLLRGID